MQAAPALEQQGASAPEAGESVTPAGGGGRAGGGQKGLILKGHVQHRLSALSSEQTCLVGGGGLLPFASSLMVSASEKRKPERVPRCGVLGRGVAVGGVAEQG